MGGFGKKRLCKFMKGPFYITCRDEDGLRMFYYLVQDLKCLVFSLVGLHFKLSPFSDSTSSYMIDMCNTLFLIGSTRPSLTSSLLYLSNKKLVMPGITVLYIICIYWIIY